MAERPLDTSGEDIVWADTDNNGGGDVKKATRSYNSTLRPVSDKKRVELAGEEYIRELLLKRANGKCEECGNPPDWRGLSYHEKLFRSQGGRLTLWNTIVLCGKCHARKHGIEER